MRINLINLDRSPERLETFRTRNGFLNGWERVRAVEGRGIDRRALLAAGQLDARLTYTDGALGCALSHMAIWDRLAAQAAAETIAEDDAVFHSQFEARSAELLGSIEGAWDCVLWGWNFDTVLVADFLPGISPALVHFDQNGLRGTLDRFQGVASRPQLFRLFRAFGTVCYSLTPQGAQKLLEACRPMRAFTLSVPGLPGPVPNYGLDIMMNAVYPQLQAYVAFPPLVVTPNDRATSLVQ